MPSRTRLSAAALLVAGGTLISACSSGASANPPTSPSVRPTPSGSVTTPDPNFDFGFTIRITDQGFHPQWLVSLCCKPVTWINDTNGPVKVVFDHQLVH